ncbi:Hypothetical_protein [Hexamita inflata]|uniref:Hypothetical_protein n=1 Tax=Hexamita inflata TaxID=28002 RepID=A0AA86TJ75_9EUKA|nr:Hypothetical protein HINF_LOCUS6541 [Hexamita inflata]
MKQTLISEYNGSCTTLLREQLRAARFRNGWLWLWQVEPASVGETGSKSTSRNWNIISLFSSASTAGFLERKLNFSKTLGTSWLTRIDYDQQCFIATKQLNSQQQVSQTFLMIPASISPEEIKLDNMIQLINWIINENTLRNERQLFIKTSAQNQFVW